MINTGKKHASIRAFAAWALAVSALNAAGCGDETAASEDDAALTVSDSIILGTSVTSDTIGTPIVTYPGPTQSSVGICSGTMLSDRWLLTAKHCVAGQVATSVTAKIAGGSTTVRGVEMFLHPSVDVALVRMNASLLTAQGIPFANPLFLGKASSLQSKTLFCQGVGGDGTGPARLRSANMNADLATPSIIRFFFTSTGPKFTGGDSGLACFITIDGVRRITSVHSTGVEGVSADEVPIDTFRDWAQGIVGNAATIFVNWDFAGGAQALVPSGPNRFATVGGTFGQYDMSQLLIGNDEVSSFTVPPLWRLNLFSNAGFAGGQLDADFTTPALTDFNDQTSSVRVVGSAMLFTNVDMGGAALPLYTAGKYPLNAAFNNQVSSLRVPAGWRVTLFDEGFSGSSRTFQEGSYSVVGTFNDLASTAVVEEPAGVYVDPNFGGAVGKLLPGCFNSTELGVPDNSISSLYVPEGLSVRLFANSNFAGAAVTLTNNQSSLAVIGFDNQVSSICVSRI